MNVKVTSYNGLIKFDHESGQKIIEFSEETTARVGIGGT